MEATPTVVFVCLHGAAKSVLAAAYFERLAAEQGANLRATAAGLDPDPEVSPRVAQALLEEGLDVCGHRPRRVTRGELARAWRVVSFGCDLTPLLPPGVAVDRWDDVPSINQDFNAVCGLIRARVPQLLEEWKIAERGAIAGSAEPCRPCGS